MGDRAVSRLQGGDDREHTIYGGPLDGLEVDGGAFSLRSLASSENHHHRRQEGSQRHEFMLVGAG